MRSNYLEKKLKLFFPDMNALQTSSGTAALITILSILKNKYKHKDEVILPSVSCPAILFAVNFLNLKPIFVDMELSYFNMSFKDIKKKVNKKTLSVVFVHCYGLTGEIDKVKKFLSKKKVFLIEDACLVFGGIYKKKHLGSYGDASILSFGYDKVLSHKGGSLIVKSNKIFNKCKTFLIQNPLFKNIKINKKVLDKKFNELNLNIKERQKNAFYIYKNLTNKLFLKPKLRKDDVYWRYPIIFKGNRDKLIKKANLKSIKITKHYPSLNKFQNNSVLNNANIFDKCVINLFVKKQNNLDYLSKTVKFLNNIK